MTGLAGGALSLVVGGGNYWSVVAFSLIFFVLGTIVAEFWRGMRARQAMLGESAPLALMRLTVKNKRRYGGYVIHLGVVMMRVAGAGKVHPARPIPL